jgi:hypothetical protein
MIKANNIYQGLPGLWFVFLKRSAVSKSINALLMFGRIGPMPYSLKEFTGAKTGELFEFSVKVA